MGCQFKALHVHAFNIQVYLLTPTHTLQTCIKTVFFTVGHYTQYYTDKPQWTEKNWEKKVVAFINFINIFKGEITNLIMKL